MTSLNSIQYFLDSFEGYNDQTAFIWNDKGFSYSQLLNRINHWKHQLTDLVHGDIIGLEGDFSPETIAILFVLIEKNTIIVPLDIHNSTINIKKKEIAQLDYLIQVKNELEVNITKTNGKVDEKNNLYKSIQQKCVPGLVLFTSGSSGTPKGAVHDFSKLLTKFSIKRQSLLTINFLLFDHWGGLNTLFHILSNGGTVIILENRKPDYVCGLIEKYKAELLPASPTFLNMMIFSRAFERHSLESLKIISYGAEPMPESLLLRLNTLFPHIKLQQTYGLIELGVMRSKSKENDSLWVKIGGEGYQTRVVDGILQIKSDSAMVGYLNAPSPFTDDGWFITGDSVEENGEYLKILGRKSEMINVGGEKVFPQEVENVIAEVPGVIDVIVFAENNALAGKIICAKIKYEGSETKTEMIKNIKTYCRTRLEPFKIPIKIIFTENTFETDRYKKRRVNES